LDHRISGIVKLMAPIDREGAVIAVKLISGHPLLANSAIDAVKQWRYRPTYLGGKAVPVVIVVEVPFVLPIAGLVEPL
jgi:outer membrane biosynthesis protein TonB